jgi:hypothetical protein
MIRRERIDTDLYAYTNDDDKVWYCDRLGRAPKLGDIFIYQTGSPDNLTNRLGIVSYCDEYEKLYMNQLRTPSKTKPGDKVIGTYKGFNVIGDMVDLGLVRSRYGIIILSEPKEYEEIALGCIR